MVGIVKKSLFYRWGNQGMQQQCDLPKVTQSVGELGFEPLSFMGCTMSSFAWGCCQDSDFICVKQLKERLIHTKCSITINYYYY